MGAPGCIGGQLDPDQPCFAHSDDDGRAAAMRRLRDGISLDFLLGAEVTEALLAEMLAAAPTKDGRRVLPFVDLRGASFQRTAWFGGVSFRGDARFGGASFAGGAWFDRATFQGDSDFHTASFGRASGPGRPWFGEMRFQGGAGFGGATFAGTTRFDGEFPPLSRRLLNLVHWDQRRELRWWHHASTRWSCRSGRCGCGAPSSPAGRSRTWPASWACTRKPCATGSVRTRPTAVSAMTG